MKRYLPVVLIVAVLAVVILWYGTRNAPQRTSDQSMNEIAGNQEERILSERDEAQNPMVTIRMESGGEIKIELYPDIAPNTVKNFVYLVRQGFYDGTIFHRVIPGFMIQGGDPEGTGMGGPGYSIRGEFTSNGFRNDLRHTRGVISMARTADPNSAGSQFFIMVADAPHLDGHYAAFGRVVSGMDEVDRIVNTPRDRNDRPLQDQRMAQVTVEWDVDDVEPEKITR